MWASLLGVAAFAERGVMGGAIIAAAAFSTAASDADRGVSGTPSAPTCSVQLPRGVPGALPRGVVGTAASGSPAARIVAATSSSMGSTSSSVSTSPCEEGTELRSLGKSGSAMRER